MNLALLFAAHLIGDFLLQNNWMQAKSKSSFVCTIHVIVYSLPFWPILWHVPIFPSCLIFVEHWLQDRFALHLKWMKFYRQTPPDKWPVGPLCVDQSFHLAFIAAIYVLVGGK